MNSLENSNKRMLGKSMNTPNSAEAFLSACSHCQCYCDSGGCSWMGMSSSSGTFLSGSTSYGSSSGLATDPQ